jgi:beta-glucosidase
VSRVETLINVMTLPEKLGQLTMTSGSYALTGPLRFADPSDAIRAGTLGSLLNVVGPAEVHALQRIAVKESRLGVPLLIGFAPCFQCHSQRPRCSSLRPGN